MVTRLTSPTGPKIANRFWSLRPITVRADKAYNTNDFVTTLWSINFRPHFKAGSADALSGISTIS